MSYWAYQMKKYPLFALIFILAFSEAFAQDLSTKKDKNILSLNVTSYYQTRLSLCQKQLKENPLDGKISNIAGFYFYKLGDYNAAIEYYKRAIALNPGFPISYNNLGVIYLKTNHYGLAEKHFKKAIELDPHYIKAICNLGVTCFRLKRYSDALRLYNRAKDIDPKYIEEKRSRLLNKKKRE